MNIKELLEYGNKLLKENDVEDANIISRTLAEFVLDMNRTQMVVNENKTVEEENKVRYYLALIEIIQGMPLQYIINKQEFMGLSFYVDENVLIPQPDTEILVEETLFTLNKKIESKKIDNKKSDNKKLDILDMCTGSGAIAVSIAKNIDRCKILAVDISKKALEITNKNIINNEVTDKVETLESNMFEKVSGQFDIIVSNPPYIKSEVIETLSEQVKHEPNIALDGGKDGLEFYRTLVEKSHEFLKDKGYLLVEIGYDQKDEVIDLIKKTNMYEEVYSKKDLSGNDRIVIVRKK